MASTDKEDITTKSLAKDLRRSRKRQHDQKLQTSIATLEADGKRDRYDAPDKQQKYDRDMRRLDEIVSDNPGEVEYQLLGNKRLRRDNPDEQTRTRGVLTRRTKVLKRDLDTGRIHIARFEKENWRKYSSYKFDEDGKLAAKSIRYKDGSFEERWERDESGDLIRTKFNNRGIFSTVSEEMSGPDRAGYRTLTRRKAGKEEIFERDTDGNLERIGYNDLGYSRLTTKSADRKTSETSVRKLGGAFSKSHRSLLTEDGIELGRDVTAQRRLLNKRSATYDDATGQLTSTKHTFGKLFKRDTVYVGAIKMVSTKILGVRVGTKLKDLSAHELKARRMRADEAAWHKEAWHSEPTNRLLRPSVGFTTSRSEMPQSPLDERYAGTEFPQTSRSPSKQSVHWEEETQSDDNSIGEAVSSDHKGHLLSLINRPVPTSIFDSGSIQAESESSMDGDEENVPVRRSVRKSRFPATKLERTAGKLSRSSSSASSRGSSEGEEPAWMTADEGMPRRVRQTGRDRQHTGSSSMTLFEPSSRESSRGGTDPQSILGSPPSDLANEMTRAHPLPEEDFGNPAQIARLRRMLKGTSDRPQLDRREHTSNGLER